MLLSTIFSFGALRVKVLFTECQSIILQGMACVGRQKVCNIVPSNHFGPIPGVEVGTLWKFRVQVSMLDIGHTVC